MTKPRQIVLIGTAHKYQKLSLCCLLKHAQAFQRFLLEKCPQYGIKTVAEEMNEQALEETREEWERYKKVLERTDWPKEKLERYKQALEKDREDWDQHKKRLESKEWIKEELMRCGEALEWHKERMSIPQRVAKELSLKPLPCDPNRGQRTKLGIFHENDLRIQPFLNSSPPMSEDEIQRQILEGHRKRERYWLEQLQQEVSESEYPVLFICGAKHVDTFSKLLEEHDFNVICICKDWEPQCH